MALTTLLACLCQCTLKSGLIVFAIRRPWKCVNTDGCHIRRFRRMTNAGERRPMSNRIVNLRLHRRGAERAIDLQHKVSIRRSTYVPLPRQKRHTATTTETLAQTKDCRNSKACAPPAARDATASLSCRGDKMLLHPLRDMECRRGLVVAFRTQFG